MQSANAVYRKLRDSGFEVFPVNPRASEVEGTACYPVTPSIILPRQKVLFSK
jgi:predicted CoA-binding protein